jgi:hypothetical protein
MYTAEGDFLENKQENEDTKEAPQGFCDSDGWHCSDNKILDINL